MYLDEPYRQYACVYINIYIYIYTYIYIYVCVLYNHHRFNGWGRTRIAKYNLDVF